MSIRFPLGLVVLLAYACSPGLGRVPPDSGVEGFVTVGPSCPVVQVGQPCPDQPYPATLTVLDEYGINRISRVVADSKGYFRVALAPGKYVLNPESPGILPRAAPVPVIVQANHFTRQDIAYDSGIR